MPRLRTIAFTFASCLNSSETSRASGTRMACEHLSWSIAVRVGGLPPRLPQRRFACSCDF
jgi:hypothetical protein